MVFPTREGEAHVWQGGCASGGKQPAAALFLFLCFRRNGGTERLSDTVCGHRLSGLSGTGPQGFLTFRSPVLRPVD